MISAKLQSLGYLSIWLPYLFFVGIIGLLSWSWWKKRVWPSFLGSLIIISILIVFLKILGQIWLIKLALTESGGLSSYFLRPESGYLVATGYRLAFKGLWSLGAASILGGIFYLLYKTSQARAVSWEEVQLSFLTGLFLGPLYGLVALGLAFLGLLIQHLFSRQKEARLSITPYLLAATGLVLLLLPLLDPNFNRIN